MRSLTLKLIIAFLVVSLVGTVLVVILARRATANEFGTFVFSHNQSLFVNELAEYYRTHGSWEGVEQVLPEPRFPGNGSGRGMGPGGMVALVDTSGKVIVSGAGRRAGDRISTSELSHGQPILVDDQQVGEVILGPQPFRPDVNEDAFLTRVNRTVGLTALGATAAALFLGVLLSRALTRPIHELTAATRAVAQGDFGHQVEVRSKDELGDLATSFNQMSAELDRSSKLRRQMTADIAHDLRTPLSVILGHAEALKDGVLPPTEATFDIIHDEARHLSRLVDDLRILSLADAGELPLARRPTDPGPLLERAAAAQAARAKDQGVTLQVNVPVGLPQVDVDSDRMAQVLNNLLENALTHTPPGGTITLDAQSTETGVRLRLRDTGSGIAPEDLSRIFDRHYRADKSRRRREGGTGLGLAIARSLVRRHDGRIWAESKPGAGAVFFIELPAVQTGATSPA